MNRLLCKVLIALLDDASEAVRINCIWSLRDLGLGAAPAIPRLFRALSDDSRLVRVSARRLLVRLIRLQRDNARELVS